MAWPPRASTTRIAASAGTKADQRPATATIGIATARWRHPLALKAIPSGLRPGHDAWQPRRAAHVVLKQTSFESLKVARSSGPFSLDTGGGPRLPMPAGTVRLRHPEASNNVTPSMNDHTDTTIFPNWPLP